MMLSPGHGASLATTAGITAVITGVIASGLIAQAPPAGDPAGALAAGAVGLLFAGAGALYAARNAIGLALDAGGDAALAARGLRLYHLGMAGLFAGLALAAAWRLALPHGALGWGAAAVALALAGSSVALASARPWRSVPARDRGGADVPQEAS